MYTLYIAENCHQCAEVVHYLNETNVTYSKINVDTSEEGKPPIQIFAFPALFKDGELIGYGTDIKTHFIKKSHS